MTTDELLDRIRALKSDCIRTGLEPAGPASIASTHAAATLLLAQALCTLVEQLQPIAEISVLLKAKLIEEEEGRAL